MKRTRLKVFKRILILGFLLFASVIFAQSSEETDSFLVISDIHLSPSSTDPMEFSPKARLSRNDLDLDTYKNLMKTLDAKIKSGAIRKPQFILLLGDLVVHGQRSKQTVIDAEQIVFATIKQRFPDIPIVYTFGNNDSLVRNYGPFRKDGSEQLRSPLDVLRTVWPNGQFVSTGILCRNETHSLPCMLNENTAQGYYSAYIKRGLRLISLNSVLFSFSKKLPSLQTRGEGDRRADAGLSRQSSFLMFAHWGRGAHNDSSKEWGKEQLQWFEKQMQEAQLVHDEVLIVMHIPPGYNLNQPYFWSDVAFWSDEFLGPFLKIVEAHDDSIVGILAAHTHKDELKVIKNKSTLLAAVFLNPALSTSHGNAPAVRSYLLKHGLDQHWHLTDYQTYYFTQSANEKIDLKQLYRFREVYCHSDTYSMKECLEKLNIEDMQRYFTAGNRHYLEKISRPQNIYILRT